jgi:predicted nuclease of predicted toxin-antitoxin system
MARLYSNENFPLPVVEELRRLGHDVLTIQEPGKANQEYPDEAVLAAASADERIVLTINRKHFRQLHHTHPNHQGIILCTTDVDFIGQAQQIHAALAAHSTFVGQLIRVNRPLRS